MEGQTAYLKLNDIDAYKIAFHLSNYVWGIVINWEYFERDGGQTTSTSNGFNFGKHSRRFWPLPIHFYRFAQGSLKECFDWIEKCKVRNLIPAPEYEKIFSELQKLPKSINQLIQFTQTKLAI